MLDLEVREAFLIFFNFFFSYRPGSIASPGTPCLRSFATKFMAAGGMGITNHSQGNLMGYEPPSIVLRL
jgi:hypothetical protein